MKTIYVRASRCYGKVKREFYQNYRRYHLALCIVENVNSVGDKWSLNLIYFGLNLIEF